MNKLFLTYKEAAEQLTISESTLKRLVYNGQIKRTKIRGCARISNKEIEQFIQKLM